MSHFGNFIEYWPMELTYNFTKVILNFTRIFNVGAGNFCFQIWCFDQ